MCTAEKHLLELLQKLAGSMSAAATLAALHVQILANLSTMLPVSTLHHARRKGVGHPLPWVARRLTPGGGTETHSPCGPETPSTGGTKAHSRERAV